MTAARAIAAAWWRKPGRGRSHRAEVNSSSLAERAPRTQEASQSIEVLGSAHLPGRGSVVAEIPFSDPPTYPTLQPG